MNLEDADYHDIVGINCHGYIIANPDTIKILIEHNVPFEKIFRGVAKIMRAADLGIWWEQLAEAPSLNLGVKNEP